MSLSTAHARPPAITRNATDCRVSPYQKAKHMGVEKAGHFRSSDGYRLDLQGTCSCMRGTLKYTRLRIGYPTYNLRATRLYSN
jgi:hypothetical protein